MDLINWDMLDDQGAEQGADPAQNMNANGFVHLPIPEPPQRLVGAIKNAIQAYDLAPGNNPDPGPDFPSRHYQGRFNSHFSGITHQFMDERINDTYIFYNLMKLPEGAGTPSDPVVVYTKDVDPELIRPYRVGPLGEMDGKAMTIILPLEESLGPENGFLHYVPGSHLWTWGEYVRRLQTGDMKFKEDMRVLRTEALGLPEGLVIRFPAKSHCSFVCKGYEREILGSDGTSYETLYNTDANYIVPFMRHSMRGNVID